LAGEKEEDSCSWRLATRSAQKKIGSGGGEQQQQYREFGKEVVDNIVERYRDATQRYIYGQQ
jgi:hypothetical protein